ncbi:MAG: Fe-S cluster assembly protein SufD [Pseudomonadota bacterium]
MSLVDSLLSTAPETSAGWWQQSRDAHRAIVDQHGLPDRRQENWKYTALRSLEGHQFQPVEPGLLQPEDLAQLLETHRVPPLAGSRMTFVNGHFAASLSHVDEVVGLRVSALSQLGEAVPSSASAALGAEFSRPDEGFAALNTLLASDGVLLELAGGNEPESQQAAEAPVVELLFVDVPGAAPSAPTIRNVIKIGAGASLALVERYVSAGDGVALINSLSQLELGENCRLSHVRLPQLGEARSLISRLDVRLGEASDYRCYGLDLSGTLVRHDLNVALIGEGAQASLNGVYAPRGQTHIDNHVAVDHQVRDAISSQTFKGVLSGRSRGVFNGKVVVQEGADGTDASQSNANLLLSADAEIDTKPELEIYADDVKCAHGTTVGALSGDQLFYLTARGIPESEARRMLTIGFCREVLEGIPVETVRDHAISLLTDHLQDIDA